MSVFFKNVGANFGESVKSFGGKKLSIAIIKVTKIGYFDVSPINGTEELSRIS